MPRYMQEFLDKVMRAGSQNMQELEILQAASPHTISYDLQPDIRSISYNTRPKEDEVGSSIFVSKTKRGHSISEVPGPGSYNVEYKHEISKNVPANFGSGCHRNTDVYRNNVNLPFTDPSYLENPPVGYYSQTKLKERLNRIRSLKGPIEHPKLKNEIVIKGSRATRHGFNSTSKREVNRRVENHKGSPGPGAYDLTFKDIIKMMDQKLAIRYQISPFGSGKPRFDDSTNRKIDLATPNKSQDVIESGAGFSIRDKHAASDILNEHYKNKEKYRSSYTYASGVGRFKELYQNSAESLNKHKKANEPVDLSLIDDEKLRKHQGKFCINSI